MLLIEMKPLSEIITELQALDTTELANVVAGINQAVADLQPYVAAPTAESAADPDVSVTVTTQSGATKVFVAQS